MNERQLAAMEEFVAEHKREREEWARTPLPRYFHSCSRHVRLRGIASGQFVSRCACGGIQMGGFGGWIEKNKSRKYHREQRRKLGLK